MRIGRWHGRLVIAVFRRPAEADDQAHSQEQEGGDDPEDAPAGSGGGNHAGNATGDPAGGGREGVHGLLRARAEECQTRRSRRGRHESSGMAAKVDVDHADIQGEESHLCPGYGQNKVGAQAQAQDQS